MLNTDSIWNRLISLGEDHASCRDRGLTTALLTALDKAVPAAFAVRRFLPLPTISHSVGTPDTGGPAERDFGPHVDQTNYSVVVNDRVVVKWLTPPVPLPRTPEVLAHLVDVGFKDTAPPYAALTRVDGPQEVLLALVTGYLPEATDGWEWCADEAEAGRTDFAPALGRLAADLHLALSTFPTSASPAPASPTSASPASLPPPSRRRPAPSGTRSGPRPPCARPWSSPTATTATGWPATPDNCAGSWRRWPNPSPRPGSSSTATCTWARSCAGATATR